MSETQELTFRFTWDHQEYIYHVYQGLNSGTFVIPEAMRDTKPKLDNDPISPSAQRNLTITERASPLSNLEKGELLFRALFQGGLASSYTPSVNQRLFFDFAPSSDDPAVRQAMMRLHNLPWECLIKQDRWLAMCDQSSIVRSPGDIDAPPIPLGLRLSVLVISSDPSSAQLQLDQDLRDMIDAAGFLVKVSLLTEQTREALHEKLNAKQRVDILHYMGHGAPGILFPGDKNTPPILIDQLLAEIDLLPPSRRPKLIFLNACHGSDVIQTDRGLTGLALKLTHIGLPAVISMRGPIYDVAATAFSKAFYTSLFKGQSLEAACRKGRTAIFHLESPHGDDWSLPCLYTNSPEACLLPRSLVPMTLSLFVIIFALIWLSVAVGQPKPPSLAMETQWTEQAITLAPQWQVGPLEHILQSHQVETRSKSPNAFLDLRLYRNQDQIKILASIRRKGKPTTEKTITRPWPEDDHDLSLLHQELACWVLDQLAIPALDIRSNMLGLQAQDRNELDVAEQHFAQATLFNPRDGVAFANLAALRFAQGRFEDALAPALTAANLAKQQPIFHYNLGHIFLQTGRPQEAMASFSEALKLQPSFLEGLHEIAKYKLEQGQFQEAEDTLLRCFHEGGKSDPRIRKTMGKVLRAEKRYALAAEHLKIAYEQAETTWEQAEILSPLILSLNDLQRMDEVQTWLLRFLELPNATQLPAWQDLAGLAEALNLALPVGKDVLAGRRIHGGPAALVLKVHGSHGAKMLPDGRDLMPQSAIPSHKSLELAEDTRLSLITKQDWLVTLSGQGTYDINHLPLEHAHRAPGLYAAMVHPLMPEELAYTSLLSPASRGEQEEYALIAPRGRIIAPPQYILFTHVEGAQAYRLYLTLPGQGRRQLTVTPEPDDMDPDKGQANLKLCRIPWPAPWPLLSPNQNYRLTLDPIFAMGDGPQATPQLNSNFSLGSPPAVEDLAQTLVQLDQVFEAEALEKRVNLMRQAGMLGDALEMGFELWDDAHTSGNALGLADSYLAAGLAAQARDWYTSTLAMDPDRHQRMLAEAGLGWALIALDATDCGQEHLDRARVLSKLIKDPMVLVSATPILPL